jgi:hypothetical protein
VLVKYNTSHKQSSKKWKQDISKIDNWAYHQEMDTWVCPNGRTLHFLRERQKKNENRYELQVRHYRSADCEGCPFKGKCSKASGNREIEVSMAFLRYKTEARKQLRGEEARELSVRRMTEVESVFGQIKNNRGFSRFLLRGLSKVSLEVGWLSLAHNLLKRSTLSQKLKTVGQG